MKTMYPTNKLMLIENASKNTSAVSRNKMAIIIAASLIFISFQSSAQLFPPGNPAQFGVDGDLMSDTRLKGSFSAAGSHDWFKTTAGTGIGVFTTTDEANWTSQIANGKNLSFAKKMQYGAYTIQNGLLMLDGSYSRDYFGLGTTNLTSDKTVFLSGNNNNKNHLNPQNWVTVPSGDAVPAKADIIDSYIHMRRNGNSVAIGNPSDLIVYFAASTLGTEGTRYMDFELFKTELSYNGGNGKFSQASSSATGGREIWEFNANGSVKTFGSMSLGFSFSSSQVEEISIYIWVPYTTYASITPSAFDFDTEWAGSGPGGYGFAKIKAKNGGSLPAWGAVNTSVVNGPTWGTSSKGLGSMAGGANYASTGYDVGQFAEASINLTALGVDPALATNFDKCSPPYKKVVVKSRSSSSFTSSLQDFAGPFEFLDSPTVPATISSPGAITCASNSLSLSPLSYIVGANYVWSTTDGNIVSGQNGSTAIINKKGTYTLTASLYEGCLPTTGTITINEDKFAPVTEATYLGALTLSPIDSVVLMADTASSPSPIAASQGIQWNWSGPNGFNSNIKNPKTNQPGTYYVTATEVRNGCADTKAIVLLSYAEATLPLKFVNFSIEKQTNKNVLSWKMAETINLKGFEVEESTDGRNFKTVSYVLADENIEDYKFKDAAKEQVTYYRVKAIGKTNAFVHSSTIKTGGKANGDAIKAYVERFSKNIVIDYYAVTKEQVEVILYNTYGQKISTATYVTGTGSNKLSLITPPSLSPGTFLVVVKTQNTMSSTKIIF